MLINKTPATYISEGKVGDQVHMHVLCKSSVVKQARNGAYVQMTVFDGQAEYDAKVWKSDKLVPLGVVEVVGQLDSFNGIQINVSQVVARPDMDPAMFAVIGPETRKSLRKTFEGYIEDIEDDDLRELLYELFTFDYSLAPAAIKMHHNYGCGWLQHTVEVIESAVALAKTPQFYECNLDAVIAGAMLHDYGKFSVYNIDGDSPSWNVYGSLFDHILLGFAQLYPKLEPLGPLGLKILHIIGAHHGELAYGSPIVPCCNEAQIVHEADLLSSKANVALFAKYDESGWSTDKVKCWNTNVWK